MTRAQGLLFAALVLAPLFSLLMRAVKRRLEGEAPRDRGPDAASVAAPARTPPPAAGAGPRDTPRGAAGMVVASAAAGGRAPSRLGSHREVRRAVVLMTVLGPCRALEPPGA
jgi:hypothetical protein